ncbi:DUF3313 family protein [Ferrimonas sp. SCSIO 43195]|uniref:DUF3313 family protein n=1 Tax=Ferrimonas sp. SCSIO 43195 TaxID=2822844 RepID=UPI0020758A0F|nr:DUF3313 family protein [Ferrimonas sp. SCSIO 43195]USD35882.1 DUF3313 family protein [Ferrimonas sp. SCSIO 43195]
MYRNLSWLLPIVGALVLTACSSKAPTEEELALANVPSKAALKEVDYSQDERGVQWIAADIDPEYYTALLIAPVQLAADAKREKQIPVAVLTKLGQVLTQRLQASVKAPVTLETSPGEHTVQLNLRVSRASAVPEDMRLTEVIPVGAVIGALKMAAGTRDESVRIVIEAQLVDSVTKAPLAERIAVMSAAGVLENDHSTLKFEQIQGAVDDFVNEVRTFVYSAAYQVRQQQTQVGS